MEDHQEAEEDSEVDHPEVQEDHLVKVEEVVDPLEGVQVWEQDQPQEGPNL